MSTETRRKHGLEQDDECPLCRCGTIEIDGTGAAVCRGECGSIIRTAREAGGTTPKHTPGPWWHRPDPQDFEQLIHAKAHGGVWVAFVKQLGEGFEDEVVANARLIAAAPTMLDALQAAVACGPAHRVSLYDHEAVEGWRWDHPDGREWIEVTGDWSETPLHPLIEAAIDFATQEASTK